MSALSETGTVVRAAMVACACSRTIFSPRKSELI